MKTTPIEAQREANLTRAEQEAALIEKRKAKQLERDRVMRLPPEELQALLDSGEIAHLFEDDD